ncbi:MAG TPA: hypothetical protein VFO88_00340, partial [Gaiellaceae bacterium]|nr:hypothetical protein [Gaiellaceae bacterium]
FPGTLLLVSHDRALLDAIAERTLAIEDGRVRSYEGGWADYVRARAERVAPPEPPVEPVPARRPRTPKPAAAKKGPDPLVELEREIEAQERVVARLEAELADDWTNIDTIAAHRRAREDLQRLFARWEELLDRAPS